MIHSIRTLPIWREVYTVDCKLNRFYTVVKFDGLLNVESVYQVTALSGGSISCPCFQGKFGRCRHRPLTIIFDMECKTNKRWFYDFEMHIWYMPINIGRV